MASSSEHPWDRDQPWDDPSDAKWSWDDLADEFDADDLPTRRHRERPSKEEAEVLLGEYLLDRYTSGAMDAKEACTIAFYCYHCGILGVCKEIAVHPESTGHFTERIEKALGFDMHDERMMVAKVPGHSPSTTTRVVHEWVCFPSRDA